jgi:hydrogenase nickel incorporation protein HypA/HybF
MHEASLAGGVLQLVEDTARREGFARLLELRLEAGQLAGVDIRALRFALESLAPGTLLDGARIEIDEPPGQAWCMACAQTVAIAQRGDACPVCSGYQLQPTGGMELRVVDMRVADD